MQQRIIFIHGTPAEVGWMFAWAPWLKSELMRRGYEAVFETMPDSIGGRLEYWQPFLADWLKVRESDVIVGWSTGAVAAMRYAENHRVKGSILISPNHTDLGDESERQTGNFDTPWDWESIKTNQSGIDLFYGNDDPYIPQDEFNYIAQKLACHKHPIAGGKHFIDQTGFPELLECIVAKYPAQT